MTILSVRVKPAFRHGSESLLEYNAEKGDSPVKLLVD